MTWDAIFKFLSERWPVLSVVVAVIIFACWVTWKVSKYHTSIENVKDRVNKLPCSDHLERLNSIEELNHTVSSTNDIVTEMSKWIMERDKRMIGILVKKNSPYVITSIGYRILNDSGGKKAVDENIDFFEREINASEPKTLYDVENQAMNIIIKNIGNEAFNPVKKYIYYSPNELEAVDPETKKEVRIKLSLPSLFNIIGLYLRDKYVSKYPEIEN